MANQKGFTVTKLILFILALATVALFAYGAIQPIFKSAGGEKYFDFYKTIMDDFPDVLKSSAKDKLFPISVLAILLVLLGGSALFTGIASLVVLISGIMSLFGRRRLKAVWLLVAGGFNLSFISVASTSFFGLEKVELAMGGILIVVATSLGVVIYALEDYFCGDNKSARRFVGTIGRIAISGGFIYISLTCFREIYRFVSSSVGYSQYWLSDNIYINRIEEDLPKKLFAFAAVGTFYLGMVVNIFLPMLPAICGSRSLQERYKPKNRNVKFIVQSILMAVFMVGCYYGTIIADNDPRAYAMGGGLLTMLIILGISLVLAIVLAIIDPKSKIVAPDPAIIVQPQPQAVRGQNTNLNTGNKYAKDDTPKTTDN